VIVDCALYEKGHRRLGGFSIQQAASSCHDPDAFVWLGLYEPSEGEFEEVRLAFALHELAVEDAINAHQRPKLEVYGETLFVVLKTARYVDPEEVVEFGEIQVFVGEGFAVVVRHGEASALAGARRSIEERPDLLALGPGAVLYAVVDHVVDDYAPVVAGLEDDIRSVEYDVFSENEKHNPVERIYKLKREVLETHQAIVPLLDPLEQLATQDLPWVERSTQPYFRDVHDHVLRVSGQVVTFRDLLTSVLEANLTRVGVRQNEDMRKISAWVAIAAVPTMVAGIYGMNFEHMPELQQEWAYPAVLLAIALVCVLLYRAFRRSGWL
jgi:magnesium transporter